MDLAHTQNDTSNGEESGDPFVRVPSRSPRWRSGNEHLKSTVEEEGKDRYSPEPRSTFSSDSDNSDDSDDEEGTKEYFDDSDDEETEYNAIQGFVEAEGQAEAWSGEPSADIHNQDNIPQAPEQHRSYPLLWVDSVNDDVSLYTQRLQRDGRPAKNAALRASHSIQHPEYSKVKNVPSQSSVLRNTISGEDLKSETSDSPTSQYSQPSAQDDGPAYGGLIDDAVSASQVDVQQSANDIRTTSPSFTQADIPPLPILPNTLWDDDENVCNEDMLKVFEQKQAEYESARQYAGLKDTDNQNPNEMEDEHSEVDQNNSVDSSSSSDWEASEDNVKNLSDLNNEGAFSVEHAFDGHVARETSVAAKEAHLRSQVAERLSVKAEETRSRSDDEDDRSSGLFSPLKSGITIEHPISSQQNRDFSGEADGSAEDDLRQAPSQTGELDATAEPDAPATPSSDGADIEVITGEDRKDWKASQEEYRIRLDPQTKRSTHAEWVEYWKLTKAEIRDLVEQNGGHASTMKLDPDTRNRFLTTKLHYYRNEWKYYRDDRNRWKYWSEYYADGCRKNQDVTDQVIRDHNDAKRKEVEAQKEIHECEQYIERLDEQLSNVNKQLDDTRRRENECEERFRISNRKEGELEAALLSAQADAVIAMEGVEEAIKETKIRELESKIEVQTLSKSDLDIEHGELLQEAESLKERLRECEQHREQQKQYVDSKPDKQGDLETEKLRNEVRYLKEQLTQAQQQYDIVTQSGAPSNSSSGNTAPQDDIDVAVQILSMTMLLPSESVEETRHALPSPGQSHLETILTAESIHRSSSNSRTERPRNTRDSAHYQEGVAERAQKRQLREAEKLESRQMREAYLEKVFGTKDFKYSPASERWVFRSDVRV